LRNARIDLKQANAILLLSSEVLDVVSAVVQPEAGDDLMTRLDHPLLYMIGKGGKILVAKER
jgi:hypothetical protein